jgi:hydroxyacylglutathione hydrolase
MISVDRFVTGPLETNSYLIVDEAKKCCLIIDPAGGCDELVLAIERDSLRPEAIVLTHAHFDHCMGIPEVLERFGSLPVYVHPSETAYLKKPFLNGAPLIGSQFTYEGITQSLSEGTMNIGSFTLDIRHVPGHTPGGCTIVIGNHCLCGDALFAGSIGRSDLPGGDGELLVAEIKRKLMALPDNTIVYPGHGNRTTIGRERRNNPFL